MSKRRYLFGGALFFILYFGTLLSLWPLSSHDVWVSPDETATAAFARSYSSTGQFTISEPLNTEAGGLLGARSMVARGEVLVPGGFLGLPWLAGSLRVIFGDMILGLIGPLLAVLGVLAWGDLWRRVVSPRFGLWAGLALALHPAWLLYSSRPLMPNVPFVSLALLSAWSLAFRPRSSVWAGVAGLLLGLSLGIRVSEAIWLLPLTASLLWLFRSHFSVDSLISFAVGLFLSIGALLGLQADTYGAALGTGYTTPPVIANQAASVASTPALGHSVLNLIFPFGFHEWSILRHTWHYGLALQWWWSGLALVGALVLARQAYSRPGLRWPLLTLILTTLVSGWLAAVYGSWTFFDNPDPKLVTLGNSYARYFLPAFVGASIMVAAALEWLWSRGLRAGALIAAIILAGLSFQLVIWGPDGWLHARSLLNIASVKRLGVVENTPAEAIIITDRSDKYLLGYRDHLLVPLREESTYQALPKLANIAPLYYFGLTLPPADVAHLEKTYLAPVGLKLSPVTTLDDETLYHIHF